MAERHSVINSKVDMMLKNLSVQDFKDFGLQQIAYIRTIEDKSRTLYAVHFANGKSISVKDTLDQAILVSRQNDLEPVTVH